MRRIGAAVGFVAIVLTLSGDSFTSAQIVIRAKDVRANGEPSDDLPRQLVDTNRKLSRDLERARERLATDDYSAAVEFLQERIRETDIVGRFGGDEFLVIAPETDAAGATGFAERVRKLVESHNFAVEGKEIRITISIGVAAFDESDQAPLNLVRRAAAALANAKSNGKNRVC